MQIDVNNDLSAPKVLILYFSLSGQSRGLVNLFASGLKESGISVVLEQVKTRKKISFPFKSVWHTFLMMLTTFFRKRFPIQPLSSACYERYSLIVLAGPTWSYNPSGPILSLLDQYGKKLFTTSHVLPLISCRGYHRLHNFLLRRHLKQLGATLEDSIIFRHLVSEPWSTIGVFLKSAGYKPENIRFLRDVYPRFGHTAEQLLKARESGKQVGKNLIKQISVSCHSATTNSTVVHTPAKPATNEK